MWLAAALLRASVQGRASLLAELARYLGEHRGAGARWNPMLALAARLAAFRVPARDRADVAQEALVAACAAWERFWPGAHGEVRFRVWFNRIVLAVVVQYRGRAKVRRRWARLRAAPIGRAVEDPAGNPAARLEEEEARRAAREMVEALEINLREVLRARQLEALSVEDTAARLGISQKLVVSREARAMAALRGMALIWKREVSPSCSPALHRPAELPAPARPCRRRPRSRRVARRMSAAR